MAQHTTEPVELLDAQDRQHLLELVRQMSETKIGPLIASPEIPAVPAQVVEVLDQFLIAGILSGSSDRGLGLWDEPSSEGSRSLSADMLREIARTSPAIAYLVHTKALASWLDHSSGVNVSAGSTVSFDRTSPAGGRLFGQSFSQTPLDPAQATALTQAWCSPSPASEIISIDVAPAPDIWGPEWTSEAGWQFVRRPRTTLTSRRVPAFHGFDELEVELLATNQLANNLVAGQEPAAATALLGADHVRTGFAAHSLGILAISLGAAEKALSRAREYARNRTQGGRPIEQHDAVVQLLEQAGQGIAAADSALNHLGSLTDLDRLLFEVWQGRESAPGAVPMDRQRDLNTLRRLGGSPIELTLRCGGLHRETRYTR